MPKEKKPESAPMGKLTVEQVAQLEKLREEWNAAETKTEIAKSEALDAMRRYYAYLDEITAK